MDPAEPVQVKDLRGRVTRGIYGKNSKSEREAIFIDTGKERYLLRRKLGPAYGDRQLDRYVGHSVTCSGFLLGTTLLAETIQEAE
jgi:hypothetical protein